jgi:hypothetical protein
MGEEIVGKSYWLLSSELPPKSSTKIIFKMDFSLPIPGNHPNAN